MPLPRGGNLTPAWSGAPRVPCVRVPPGGPCGSRGHGGGCRAPPPGTLTSWSRSECPGPHSCSFRRSCRSARPRPCHSRPRSPRPPSLRTAHGAGPGGRCWAVGRDTQATSACSPAGALGRRASPCTRPTHGERGTRKGGTWTRGKGPVPSLILHESLQPAVLG